MQKINQNTTFILQKLNERRLKPVDPKEHAKACTSHMNELARLSKRELIARSNAGCPHSKLILTYNLGNFNLN